jgi:hypothetical protein
MRMLHPWTRGTPAALRGGCDDVRVYLRCAHAGCDANAVETAPGDVEWATTAATPVDHHHYMAGTREAKTEASGDVVVILFIRDGEATPQQALADWCAENNRNPGDYEMSDVTGPLRAHALRDGKELSARKRMYFVARR